MKMTVLTGPHAGKTRDISSDIKPDDLLRTFAQEDWNWQIQPEPDDTEQVVFEWTRADMVARIIRAFLHGRVVRFEGTEYRCDRAEDMRRVVGEVEDAIAYSGFHVKVESDDEIGVTIGTGPPEHPVQ